MSRLVYLLGVALLALALIGCGRIAEEISGNGLQPFDSAVQATPSDESQAVQPFNSPLDKPGTSDASPLDRNPTPEPGTATIRGELVLNGKPATGYTLYLAPIIYAGDTGDGVASLDAENGPRAEPDRTGYFHFTNVQPGSYALGISSPIGAVLIKRGDTEITLEAIEDQIVDLGTVRIVPFG